MNVTCEHGVNRLLQDCDVCDTMGPSKLPPNGNIVECPACDGDGDSGDWRNLNCATCGGRGKVTR